MTNPDAGLYGHIRRAKQAAVVSGLVIREVIYPRCLFDSIVDAVVGDRPYLFRDATEGEEVTIEGVRFVFSDEISSSFLLVTDRGSLVHGIAGEDTLETASLRLRLAMEDLLVGIRGAISRKGSREKKSV